MLVTEQRGILVRGRRGQEPWSLPSAVGLNTAAGKGEIPGSICVWRHTLKQQWGSSSQLVELPKGSIASRGIAYSSQSRGAVVTENPHSTHEKRCWTLRRNTTFSQTIVHNTFLSFSEEQTAVMVCHQQISYPPPSSFLHTVTPIS